MRTEREPVIVAHNLTVTAEEKTIIKDISFSVHAGESWAFTGPSGSGKTVLGKVLAGHCSLSSGEIIFNLPGTCTRILVPQQHDFRYMSSGRSYYQQRFDSNYGAEFPLAEEVLIRSSKGVPSAEAAIKEVASLLKIEHVLRSKLLELSNGEGKRLQLAQALLQKPDILIFDNPFIGLDKEARQILHNIINYLISTGKIIFLITSPAEVPTGITHVMRLESGIVTGVLRREEFIRTLPVQEERKDHPPLREGAAELLKQYKNLDVGNFNVAVEMRDVTVRYGEKVVLQNIDWKVMKGEKWALLGHNGAGKSTLLSLINGDNPQAYSNYISLFDHRRGSGESIWDIKKKIGYISPELHIFFQRSGAYTEAVEIASGIVSNSTYSLPKISCFEAIASGLNDQVGSSQQISSGEKRQVEIWMELLGIQHLKKQALHQASLGEQRLVLLARALIKNPPVLILDEPCQGLDREQTEKFVHIVDSVCSMFDKTLIYISHYTEDIPHCVTKFLMLEKGKIKERFDRGE